MRRGVLSATCVALACAAAASGAGDAVRLLTTSQVLESTQATDWRRPDPDNTLYVEFAVGRVIIELAPRFAPAHVANIKALAAEKFFDGLSVVRVQDNFVAQWGDPDNTRPTVSARRKLPAEFVIARRDLPFVKLPDADAYAPEAGWVDGLPAGRDLKPTGSAWLAHCYGTLGVGRDNPPDNGSGAELYVVIGHAPRQLDRNIVVAGRVLRGIELLSTLPRGTGALGFYEKKEQRVSIKTVRLAASLPEAERTPLEILRTDTPLFTRYVEARRNRRDEWYLQSAGHTDVCNITIPVRDPAPPTPPPPSS